MVPGLSAINPDLSCCPVSVKAFPFAPQRDFAEYVVAGFSPRAAMHNSNIQHDRTPAKAGDYISEFTSCAKPHFGVIRAIRG